jgi:pimeloyl-ACP methyl ester carboxylesterase
VMEHLGIKQFMVMGFCIGGPFVWNLLKRAPDASSPPCAAQPSGCRKEAADLSYDDNMKGWGPSSSSTGPSSRWTWSIASSPGCTAPATIRLQRDARLRDGMPDSPCSSCRTIRRRIRTPSRMETVMLAPKSEVSLFPLEGPQGPRSHRGAPGAFFPSARIGPERRRRCRKTRESHRQDARKQYRPPLLPEGEAGFRRNVPAHVRAAERPLPLCSGPGGVAPKVTGWWGVTAGPRTFNGAATRTLRAGP